MASPSMRDLVRNLVLSELRPSNASLYLREDEGGGHFDDIVDAAVLRVFRTVSNAGGVAYRQRSTWDDGVIDLIAVHLMRQPRGLATQPRGREVEPHLRFQGLCLRMRRQSLLRRPEVRLPMLRLLYLLRGGGGEDSCDRKRRNLDGGTSRLSSSRLSGVDSALEPFPQHDSHRRSYTFDVHKPGSDSPAKLPSGEGFVRDVLTPFVGWHIPGDRGGPPAELSEEQLLRDLLHALQGVDSACFGYNMEGLQFELRASFLLSRPVWSLVWRVLEVAGIHKSLCFVANAFLEASEGGSLLHQSLCEALREQLREYYRTVALLMAKLENLPGQSAPSELTLRRVWAWMQAPAERVRLLGSLCASCRSLRGGALASAVYSCSRLGGVARDICSVVLQRIVEPLIAMIGAWMTEGDLRDPYGEFFVCVDMSVPREDLWTRMYSLEVEMVPCFMTLELAHKILLTGKSVNFIRLCCPGQERLLPGCGSEQVSDAFGVMRSGGGGMPTAGIDSLLPLANLSSRVERAALHTNKQLVSLLMDHYDLGEHSLGLRRFLLLWQGDFVESLMDMAKADLDRDASCCFPHQFISSLDMSVRQSNAQFCPPDVLQRLGVKLMPSSGGERGWDIFLLEYAIDSPLHVVFSPVAMRQYNRAFAFLWKLRRVAHSLANCWSQHMAVHRHLLWRARGAAQVMRGDSFSGVLRLELSQTLHRCTMLRNEMHHFVENVQSYVMCEVVETSWRKLQEGWQACSDLDQVILEHQRYLTGIEERAFLAPESEATLATLHAIFALALEFAELHDSVCASSFEALEVLRDEPERPLIFGRSLTECRAQLDQLRAQFLLRVQSLLRAMEGQANAGQLPSDLRFLISHLDFNGFYEQRRAAGLLA